MPLHEDRRSSALVLTIDRPHRRNAISRSLARALGEALARAGKDDTLRAVVLTATDGDVFVSGGDLKEFSSLDDGPGGAEQVLDLGAELAAIEACPLPVLAAVTGDVLGGGCELLLLCDVVVLEQHAGIAFRHAAMGLAPAWGGTSRLLERVGSGTAAELLMTARRVASDEALALGLVNRVVPTGSALDCALELATLIAHNPRRGVEAVKRSLVAARSAQRGDAFDRERGVFTWAWSGPERRLALEAFRRRR